MRQAEQVAQSVCDKLLARCPCLHVQLSRWPAHDTPALGPLKLPRVVRGVDSSQQRGSQQ